MCVKNFWEPVGDCPTAWAIITGIPGLAVRVALALLMRAGYNWARVIIAIYAVLSLLGLIGLFRSEERRVGKECPV